MKRNAAGKAAAVQMRQQLVWLRCRLLPRLARFDPGSFDGLTKYSCSVLVPLWLKNENRVFWGLEMLQKRMYKAIVDEGQGANKDHTESNASQRQRGSQVKPYLDVGGRERWQWK